MAFLCPVRIRSNGNAKKKKHPDAKKRSFLSGAVNSLIGEHDHVSPVVVETTPRSENGSGSGPGRITGSASIETLVRVGLEKEAGIPPEARVVVLHDFTPCVDDELEVKRGSIVSILYRENDWVYVILEQLPNGAKVSEDHGSREGFIPHSYCGPLNEPQNARKKPSATTNLGPSSTETAPFYKDPSPTRYIALYKFTARDENDVNVERGEILTVLNKDDPEWFYVVRSDGQEGFVPSAFVYPLAQEPQNTYQQIDEPSHEYAAAVDVTQAAASPGQSSCNTSNPEFQNHGTELVMLYDYKAQAPDDLSVKRGDWIYADLHHQTVEGWLWAYAPKQRKYGFIPKAYARPPAMTSL